MGDPTLPITPPTSTLSRPYTDMGLRAGHNHDDGPVLRDALLADSLDMFGDAIVHGFSLYAVARGSLWQARVALLKGLIMHGGMWNRHAARGRP